MLRFFDIKSLSLYFRNLKQRAMKYLTIFIFFLIAFSSMGQSSNTDERLLKKFSQEEINGMSEEDLNFNTFCIENAFTISKFPEEKKNSKSITGSINISDINKINFFELHIELKEDAYQYFQIVGTDKILSIKPVFLIKSEIK